LNDSDLKLMQASVGNPPGATKVSRSSKRGGGPSVISQGPPHSGGVRGGGDNSSKKSSQSSFYNKNAQEKTEDLTPNRKQSSNSNY
jgi:hypothetical protein